MASAYPDWSHGDRSPGPDRPLLPRIDFTQVPFEINCGDAGIAYVLLGPAGDGGVFLIRSC